MAGAIEEHEERLPSGQKPIIASGLIPEQHGCCRRGHDIDCDVDWVVQVSRLEVLTGCPPDRGHKAFRLRAGIGVAQPAKDVHSGRLKTVEVCSVVHGTVDIGLISAHAHADDVRPTIRA